MVGRKGRRGRSASRKNVTIRRRAQQRYVPTTEAGVEDPSAESGAGLRLVGAKQMGGVVGGRTGLPGSSHRKSAYGRHRAIPLPEAHVPREILGDAAALFRAARLGRGDDMARLLRKGANPDLTDDPGDQHRDAVAFMCRNEDLGRLELDGIKLGRTACHMAALRGHGEVIQALIEGGCDVNSRDHAGVTPLMLVAQKGPAPLAALLVRSGAQVDARDLRGATALLRAAEAGQTEIVRYLIEAGANVHIPDSEYRTPLLAAAAGLDFEAVRSLLAAGADPAACDVRGADALYAAVCATGSPAEEPVLRVVSVLLDAGAGVAGLDLRLSRWAWERGHLQVAQLLMDRSILQRCPPGLFGGE